MLLKQDKMKKLHKDKCDDCGKNWDDLAIGEGGGGLHFHTHHIDGNHENNDPANLAFLCEDCHFYRHNADKEYGTDLLEQEVALALKDNLLSEGFIFVPVRLIREVGQSEAILYGTIFSLCQEKGYCYASNAYLAEKMGKDVDTITRWLRKIKKYLHIVGHQSRWRRIYVSAHFNTPAKMRKYSGKNVGVYSGKNAVRNNISNNNKKNNNKPPIVPQGGQETSKEIVEQSQEEKDIGEVIYLLRNVNPTYKLLFARKAQREAARRLVQEFGMVKIRNAITFLESCQGNQYCPVITTPITLEAKWGNLQAEYLKQHKKNKQPSGVRI